MNGLWTKEEESHSLPYFRFDNKSSLTTTQRHFFYFFSHVLLVNFHPPTPPEFLFCWFGWSPGNFCASCFPPSPKIELKIKVSAIKIDHNLIKYIVHHPTYIHWEKRRERIAAKLIPGPPNTLPWIHNSRSTILSIQLMHMHEYITAAAPLPLPRPHPPRSKVRLEYIRKVVKAPLVHKWLTDWMTCMVCVCMNKGREAIEARSTTTKGWALWHKQPRTRQSGRQVRKYASSWSRWPSLVAKCAKPGTGWGRTLLAKIAQPTNEKRMPMRWLQL